VITRQAIYEKREAEIRKFWFPDHHYTYANDKRLVWRDSARGSIYLVRYYLLHGALAVTGDIGEAIYGGWSVPGGITLPWIASLDLGYFASKCLASEEGREYDEWNEELALAAIDDEFKEKENPNQAKAEAYDLGLDSAIGNQDEWIAWLHRYGHDQFGDEYYRLAGIGEIINMRCQAHLLGLKMALAQEALAGSKP